MDNRSFVFRQSVFGLILWLFNVTLVTLFSLALLVPFLLWLFIVSIIAFANKFTVLFRARRIEAEMRHEESKLNQVLVLFVAALALMTLTLPAKAGEDVSHVEARKLQAAGEILSFEKISEIARTIKPGDILETELERSRKSGLYIYEVEILDANGVVWELDINARTGELIKMEIDD